jgi:hypothetical protein
MISQDSLISFALESLGLPDSTEADIAPLSKRGSGRTFFRFRWSPQDSAIIIHYDPERIENTYYADIAVFLTERLIPVPRIIRHDPSKCIILMEDMGNIDLWSYRQKDWEIKRTLYQKTLVAAYRLHNIQEDLSCSDIRLMEGFNAALYEWEHKYFLEHFVKGICNIDIEPKMMAAIKNELHQLVKRLMKAPPCLVHRDLQSQNVMIMDEKPFFIDFQGMRTGCAFYDLASLINDPYVYFSDEEIEELFSFYYVLSGAALDWDAFRCFFWEASIQRLMQALGAYGFLSLKLGLVEFLRHIPGGQDNIIRASTYVQNIPMLSQLLLECKGKTETISP